VIDIKKEDCEKLFLRFLTFAVTFGPKFLDFALEHGEKAGMVIEYARSRMFIPDATTDSPQSKLKDCIKTNFLAQFKVGAKVLYRHVDANNGSLQLIPVTIAKVERAGVYSVTEQVSNRTKFATIAYLELVKS
jgi:hypothetical protein